MLNSQTKSTNLLTLILYVDRCVRTSHILYAYKYHNFVEYNENSLSSLNDFLLTCTTYCLQKCELFLFFILTLPSIKSYTKRWMFRILERTIQRLLSNVIYLRPLSKRKEKTDIKMYCMYNQFTLSHTLTLAEKVNYLDLNLYPRHCYNHSVLK